jgi:hypothetical protein
MVIGAAIHIAIAAPSLGASCRANVTNARALGGAAALRLLRLRAALLAPRASA